MPGTPQPCRLAALLATLGGLLLGEARAQPAPGSDEPMPVITYSREFCDRLADHVALLQRPLLLPPIEALMLAEQGRQLCANGQLRHGITRLRRAVVLLRAAAPPGGTP